MQIDNVLILPVNTQLGREIYFALRYEKTVRLYASNLEEQPTPLHRTTSLSALPNVTNQEFHAQLQEQVNNSHIDYIFPTTDTVFSYFDDHPSTKIPLSTMLAANEELLPTDEAWLDGYTDKKGKLVYSSLLTSAENETWHITPVPDHLKKAIEHYSEENKIQGPWRAILEGETIKNMKAGLQLGHAVHRMLGVNFPLLILHEARGNVISAIPAHGSAKAKFGPEPEVQLMLDYECVFLDLDDTLIVHGAINDSIMAFVYHCKARKIPVHLITRHYRDPTVTLCEFGIAELLFQSIIWIEDDTPKSSFLKEAPNPLFIDDAFSERREVSVSTGTTCLPPDAIQSLMTEL